MLTYVIYSHTDYLDTLEIQTEYLKSYENKYLLINNNNVESEIFSNYKGIIYYDDILTYPSRLLYLKELDLDYILFIHDIDIIVDKNDVIIESIVNKMIDENIDRIDLQYDRDYRDNSINNIAKIYIDGYSDFYLNKQDCFFTYNVNPSIWKLSSFMDLMENHKNDTYRTIEETAQKYCKDKYSIYKPYSDYSYQCGYFECIYFFKFLHITHHGEYLPISNFSRLNEKFIDEWLNIVDKFLLKNNERNFRPSL
jgi:hypothetical protein